MQGRATAPHFAPKMAPPCELQGPLDDRDSFELPQIIGWEEMHGNEVVRIFWVCLYLMDRDVKGGLEVCLGPRGASAHSLGCRTALKQQVLQGPRSACCLKGHSATCLSLLPPGYLPTAPIQITKKGRMQ